MDTIKNMVWGGENKEGQEPINGQTGGGTATEPYDKGNEAISTTGATSTTAGTAPSTTETAPSTIQDTGTSEDTNPASSGAKPFQKQQGADRPTDEPNAEETAAISDKKEAAEDTQGNSDSTTSLSSTRGISDDKRNELAQKGKLPHDPNDHSGEPMHMHGGGAKTDPEGGVEGESMKAKTERSASVAHEGGGEHGKEQGTGEQWVKTSGMAAEGGDFDATKPGAGREATRLMEEKGIKTEGATIDPDAPKAEEASSGPKVSKLDKIKEKMHIGTGKHI